MHKPCMRDAPAEPAIQPAVFHTCHRPQRASAPQSGILCPLHHQGTNVAVVSSPKHSARSSRPPSVVAEPAEKQSAPLSKVTMLRHSHALLLVAVAVCAGFVTAQ